MALEPEMHAFIERTEALCPSDVGHLSIEAQRAAYDAMCAAFNPPRPLGVSASDQTVPGPDGHAIPVRTYSSEGAPADRAVLYFHGGGYVLGGLDSHDIVTARLCADIPATVITVDYRLAPEHRFPAAFEDCLRAMRYLQANAGAFGLASPAIVLAGDSAGANLAAAVSIANRDADGPALAGQVLVYGGFGAGPDLPSYREEADAPLLKASDIDAYHDHYFGADHVPDARSAPIRADLGGLPPTLLLPVEHDPLRDESYAFHDALRAAGSPSTVVLGEGLVHGCLRALGASPGTDRLVATAVRQIRQWTRAAS